jgi:hypothetical protein
MCEGGCEEITGAVSDQLARLGQANPKNDEQNRWLS